MRESADRVTLDQYCPETLKIPFSRSYKHVVTEDYLMIFGYLRELYIPRYSSEELASFPPALQWVRDNIDIFMQEGPNLGVFPVFVQHNLFCIEFLLMAEEELLGMSRDRADLCVGFAPKTAEWKEDIRLQTVPVHRVLADRFTQLRHLYINSYDRRVPDNNRFSSTQQLTTLRYAFLSDWENKREEASDVLTGTLFIKYLTVLKRRQKAISALEQKS